MKARFKIDYGSDYPFVLSARSRYWGWRVLDRLRTREDALALYEKIKDLPEYLP
jgi:hypothetical protein